MKLRWKGGFTSLILIRLLYPESNCFYNTKRIVFRLKIFLIKIINQINKLNMFQILLQQFQRYLWEFRRSNCNVFSRCSWFIGMPRCSRITRMPSEKKTAYVSCPSSCRFILRVIALCTLIFHHCYFFPLKIQFASFKK